MLSGIRPWALGTAIVGVSAGVAAVAVVRSRNHTPPSPAIAARNDADACGPPLQLTDPSRPPEKSGWPKSLPALRWRSDAVYLRTGQITRGIVTFLEAFGTVVNGNQKRDYPRDNVAFVLVCGNSFPREFATLPSDKDGLILRSHNRLVGPINVDARGIHINGRTFARREVALIHLKDPAQAQYADIIDPPDSSEPPTPEPPSGGLPRGKTAAELPWGQALWRGVLRFDLQAKNSVARYGSRGTYTITWKEDTLVRTYPNGVNEVAMHIVDMTYNGVVTDCGRDFGFNGSGFDMEGTADKYNRSYLYFRAGDPTDLPKIVITQPVHQGIIHCPRERAISPEAGDTPGFMDVHTGIPNSMSECQDPGLGVKPLRPPYTLISGSVDCRYVPHDPDFSTINDHIEFFFIRGAPPMNVAPEKKNCNTAKGRRDLVADQIKKLLDDLAALKPKIDEAAANQQKLDAIKRSYHDDMNKLLIAAAGVDVFKRIMELLINNPAFQVAGALDEEKKTATMLENLTKCVAAGMSGVQAITTGEPSDLVDYIRDPSYLDCNSDAQLNNPTKKPSGDAGGDANGGVPDDAKNEGKEGEEDGDSLGEFINAAQEEYELALVLGDAVGLGSGENEAEYIQEQLSQISGLIPEEELRKADQYVEVLKQWEENLRDLSRLNVQVAMDGFALADLGLSLKDLEKGLADCEAAQH